MKKPAKTKVKTPPLADAPPRQPRAGRNMPPPPTDHQRTLLIKFDHCEAAFAREIGEIVALSGGAEAKAMRQVQALRDKIGTLLRTHITR